MGRTDAEALILWPPDAKSQLTEKDPDARKDWVWEEKAATEDEMVGWHHRLNGHEFEPTLGNSEGQGSLLCHSSWVCRVRHDLMTEQKQHKICYYFLCCFQNFSFVFFFCLFVLVVWLCKCLAIGLCGWLHVYRYAFCIQRLLCIGSWVVQRQGGRRESTGGKREEKASCLAHWSTESGPVKHCEWEARSSEFDSWPWYFPTGTYQMNFWASISSSINLD